MGIHGGRLENRYAVKNATRTDVAEVRITLPQRQVEGELINKCLIQCGRRAHQAKDPQCLSSTDSAAVQTRASLGIGG